MDINYFNTIDDPNKAYWLGFIWCDGYVGKHIVIVILSGIIPLNLI